MPDRLLRGFQHFRDTDLERYRDLYRKLVDEGQRPRVLFIACSDSRIVPHLITESQPGEVFIVRTIGNIVTAGEDGDATSAAVEYAVAVLGVVAIIVCGHSACGAMGALYEPPDPALGHLSAWVEHARPAALSPDRLAGMDAVERDRLTAQRNVLLALERIAGQQVVRGPRSRGELLVHGWYYDIAEAELEIYDPGTRKFRPSDEFMPG